MAYRVIATFRNPLDRDTEILAGQEVPEGLPEHEIKRLIAVGCLEPIGDTEQHTGDLLAGDGEGKSDGDDNGASGRKAKARK
jgi:hypothetical protein